MILVKELKDLILSYLYPPIIYQLESTGYVDANDNQYNDITWAGKHTYGYSSVRGTRLYFNPQSAIVISSRCCDGLEDEVKIDANKIENILTTDYSQAFNGNGCGLGDYHCLRTESIDEFLIKFNHIKSKSTKVANYVKYMCLSQLTDNNVSDLIYNLKAYHPKVYDKVFNTNTFKYDTDIFKSDGYIMNEENNELTFFFKLDQIIKELGQVNTYAKANGVVFQWI